MNHPLEQTRLKRVEVKPQARVLHLEFLPLVNNTSIHLFFILLRLILSFEKYRKKNWNRWRRDQISIEYRQYWSVLQIESIGNDRILQQPRLRGSLYLVSYFTWNRASSIEFKIAKTVIGSFVLDSLNNFKRISYDTENVACTRNPNSQIKNRNSSWKIYWHSCFEINLTISREPREKERGYHQY